MKREWQTVKVWVDREIGHLVMNRPNVLNALSYQLVLEMEDAIHKLENEARVILIEGAGDHFCAGADLKYVSETKEMRKFIEQISRVFFCLERAKVPVIAAVQGYALAGGFELMQACDIVLVADSAIVGDQHSNFGLIPGGGGSQRLPRLIGRQRALALLLTGERLSGKEAASWGLAYRSVSLSTLPEESMALALKLASNSRDGLKILKSLVDRGLEISLTEGIGMEVEAFLTWVQGRDAQEGLKAFREKRSPDFK